MGPDEPVGGAFEVEAFETLVVGAMRGRFEVGTVASKSSSEAGELIRFRVGLGMGTFEVDAVVDATLRAELCCIADEKSASILKLPKYMSSYLSLPLLRDGESIRFSLQSFLLLFLDLLPLLLGELLRCRNLLSSRSVLAGHLSRKQEVVNKRSFCWLITVRGAARDPEPVITVPLRQDLLPSPSPSLRHW